MRFTRLQHGNVTQVIILCCSLCCRTCVLFYVILSEILKTILGVFLLDVKVIEFTAAF